MAKITTVVDDLSGEEGAQAFYFSYGRAGQTRRFEADFGDESVEAFEKAVGRFVKVAAERSVRGSARAASRPVGSAATVPATSVATAPVARSKLLAGGPRPLPRGMVSVPLTDDPEFTESAATLREWAAGSGIEVSDRGRIPQSVIDAYAAHLGTAYVEAPPPTPAPEEVQEGSQETAGGDLSASEGFDGAEVPAEPVEPVTEPPVAPEALAAAEAELTGSTGVPAATGDPATGEQGSSLVPF